MASGCLVALKPSIIHSWRTFSAADPSLLHSSITWVVFWWVILQVICVSLKLINWGLFINVFVLQELNSIKLNDQHRGGSVLYRSLILTNLSFFVGWTARHFLETACFILWKTIETFRENDCKQGKLNSMSRFCFLKMKENVKMNVGNVKDSLYLRASIATIGCLGCRGKDRG